MEVTDKNCNRKERIKHHLRRYCPDPCGLYTNQALSEKYAIYGLYHRQLHKWYVWRAHS